MTQVRDDLIKLRARALWKKFKGNALRPGNPEDDIILKEFVEALRGVPTQDIDKTFDNASNSDRMPKAHELKRFAPGRKADQGISHQSQSPFSLEFQDFLADMAVRAQTKFDQTGDIDFRNISDMADQAHNPRNLFVQRCSGEPTKACKTLFWNWAIGQGISKAKFLEVA